MKTELHFCSSEPASSALIRGVDGLSRGPERRRRFAGETPAVPVKRCVAVLFALAALAVAIVGLKSARQEHWAANSHAAPPFVSREDRIDRDLSLAVASALGNREGMVIVMDPRTGRVRAVVNPQLAFETAFAPGSTIKPFSTLAALRSGTIEKDSRMLCREHFSHEDFKTACSHPRSLPPLKPAEALAYSCNYYFGKLGEQLRESTFNSTLAEFGFGRPTKINRIGVREAAGKLPHGQWRAETALGEGDQIEVTPIQLLTAYSALVNGGYLLMPQIAPEAGFVKQHETELSIDDEHRQLILDGMRGAVRYGTAESAKLHSLSLYVFGKTGTATPIGGFRTHGWFVGFASALGDHSPGKPENIELALLVFVKRAHGADAAEIARPIFEAYIHATRRGEGETGGRGDGAIGRRGEVDTNPSASGFVATSPHLPVLASAVRVHLVRENVTRSMPLEDYVLGVVAAEGSTENETAALKALAVASRTYALKNLRRHANEGYDLCTTTHCQRYSLIDPIASGSRVSSLISEAVRESVGEVLQDRGGNIVDSYFSASCGGATAKIGTLWGVKAPSYLAGGSDEYCLTMPHHTWRDVISSKDLMRALNSDPRTDIGGRLVNALVARRDASGRAELITIEGAHRRTVSGWDFKIIVGRALGWNVLKSSRFEISRSGSAYVFRGSGFGHGLGLCQEGAHVMARRGASYRQILAKYFPGTHVGTDAETRRRGDGETGRRGDTETGRRGDGEMRRYGDGETERSSDGLRQTGPELTGMRALRLGFEEFERLSKAALRQTRSHLPISLSPRRSITSHHAVSVSPRPFSPSPYLPVTPSPRRPFSPSPGLPISSRRRTLSSEHFRLNYPSRLSQGDVDYVLRVLESNRADLIRRVSVGGVSFQLPTLELFINETTGGFVGRTGHPPWVAAATLRNRIELQPFELLARRRILETTIRHELVHSMIEAIGLGRAPRWLAEGLALHLAGEGPKVARYLRKTDLNIADLELRLSRPAPAEDMRADYAAAYREVKRLIDAEGESAVWRRVAAHR